MKQVLLFLCISFSVSLQAQVFVNKKNINEIDIKYLEVWERYDGDKEKFYAMVDYGQKDDPTDLDGRKLRITSEKGASLKFNGIMDALNYLGKNGWEVIHVRTIGKYDTSFVMKKTFDVPEFVNKSSSSQ